MNEERNNRRSGEIIELVELSTSNLSSLSHVPSSLVDRCSSLEESEE